MEGRKSFSHAEVGGGTHFGVVLPLELIEILEGGTLHKGAGGVVFTLS